MHLLHWVSQLWEEAQHLETEGLQKVELAVAGSEAEGLYRLLRGALSHSPMSMAQPPPEMCCQAPTATVFKPPPQEPEMVECESSASVAEGGILAQEAPSLTISQALEIVIPINMTPLHLNVGASKGFLSAGLRDTVKDHPPLGWPFVLMCARPIWG